MKFIWKLFLSATFLSLSLLLYQEIYSDYKAASFDFQQLTDSSENLEKLYTNLTKIDNPFRIISHKFKSMNNKS